MPVADSLGGVVDRLLGLEHGVQVPGGPSCAVGERHGGTANQKQVTVDALSLQVVRKLAKNSDDVVPGEHALHALQGGASVGEARSNAAANCATQRRASWSSPAARQRRIWSAVSPMVWSMWVAIAGRSRIQPGHALRRR